MLCRDFLKLCDRKYIMNITIQRRAEIALRSLEQDEKKQVLKSIEQIKSIPPNSLFQIFKLQKLSNGLDENLYVYRASHRLSLILSVKDSVCIIEDILAADRLDRLVANLKSQ